MILANIDRQAEPTLRKFARPTLYETFSDALFGFIHGALSLITQSDSPEAFKKHLETYVSAFKYRLSNLLYIAKTTKKEADDALSEMTDFEIKSKICISEATIKRLDSEISELQSSDLYGDKEFAETYQNKKERYELWEKTIGRPPFYNKFNFGKFFIIKLDHDTFSDSSLPVSKSPWLDRLASVAISSVAKFLPLIALPCEVIFTLPSFYYLCGRKELPMYAAAVLLVGCIYLMGEATCYSFRRSFTTLVTKHSDKPKVKLSPNYIYIAITAILLSASLLLITSSARIRSISFRINEAVIEQEQSLKNTLDDESKQITDPVQNVLKQLEEHPLDINSGDGLFALSVYLVLYFAAFLRILYTNDPHTEFDIIYQEYAQLQLIKQRLKREKYFDSKVLKDERSKAQSVCEAFKEEEKRRAASNKETKKDFIEDYCDNVMKSFEHFSLAWIDKRYTSYKRFFRIFCRNKNLTSL